MRNARRPLPLQAVEKPHEMGRVLACINFFSNLKRGGGGTRSPRGGGKMPPLDRPKWNPVYYYKLNKDAKNVWNNIEIVKIIDVTVNNKTCPNDLKFLLTAIIDLQLTWTRL